MVIGIDISPISGKSDHRVRGVGKYINLIKDNIEKFDKDNQYIFLENINQNLSKIDILHIPYFDPFFLNIPFIKKVKLIVTVHDLIPIAHRENFPSGIKGQIKWLINKNLLKKADAIIVDSDASGRIVRKLINVNTKKIHTVYLSCDEEFKSISESQSNEILRKINLPEKYFLYVGDVTWNKNLPMLIDAIKKVNVPLVMAGKAIKDENFDRNNPWNKDRMIMSKKIEGNDLFIKLGFIKSDELNALYNSALALCMPSLDEGFGLPVLEAMKSGCPVITSRFGSLPEIAGEAVEYVDAADIESISNSLFKLLHNNASREELIDKGFVQASKFSIKKMMEDTVRVYNSL